jgi:hypothetical protein
MDEKDLRRPIEGWTLDTLAAHLISVVSSLLSEIDKRYEQRFKAQETAVDKAFIAQEKSIQVALSSAEKAVTKAEIAVEKRFDNTNEWRAAMQDRDRNQMPRVEIEQRLDSLANSIKWAVGIMVTLLLGLFGTFLAFLKR